MVHRCTCPQLLWFCPLMIGVYRFFFFFINSAYNMLMNGPLSLCDLINLGSADVLLSRLISQSMSCHTFEGFCGCQLQLDSRWIWIFFGGTVFDGGTSGFSIIHKTHSTCHRGYISLFGFKVNEIVHDTLISFNQLDSSWMTKCVIQFALSFSSIRVDWTILRHSNGSDVENAFPWLAFAVVITFIGNVHSWSRLTLYIVIQRSPTFTSNRVELYAGLLQIGHSPDVFSAGFRLLCFHWIRAA